MNGILAAPVMAMIMLVAGNRRIMGGLVLPGAMQACGWCATALMLLASIGLSFFDRHVQAAQFLICSINPKEATSVGVACQGGAWKIRM